MILNNPQFIQMLKLGKSVRWTPATIELPTITSTVLPAPSVTNIDLYPEQLTVYNQVKDRSAALLEAKTGAGKTVISIALHQAWGGRTLVACHSLVLAKQFQAEFIKFTDIKPTLYCNGKHDQSGTVVITTHTTLRQKYDSFKGFDNLIIDEADLALTPKAVKAITTFKATRIHGFTGTIKSVYDDCNPEQSPILAKFYGYHVKHVDTKPSPLKAVYHHSYNKTYPDVFPHQDYQEFRQVLDADIERKKAQLEYITSNTDPKGYTLALFDRVDDVNNFYNAFKKRGYTVYKSTGVMKKQDREQHLADFKHTGGYLLGVSATLNRGYDQVKLSKAFILYPVKSESSIRQIVGRIIRHYKDKDSYLYLWSDSMLSFQLKAQRKIIKEHFNLDIC